MESRFQDKALTFEIWTNGPFADDALAWLAAQPPRPDVRLDWKDGEALKKYADKASNAAIRKTLNEHYFRHPLARAARRNPGRHSDASRLAEALAAEL